MSAHLQIIIVAGVSGSGKTTVGRLLAARLGVNFLEGDSLHSAANVAKMRSGVPLDDEDRAPWLRAIGDRIDAWIGLDQSGVVACSALKRAYRAALRRNRPAVRTVLLEAPRAVIAARLERREDHFMPGSLLEPQFAALEPLAPDEPAAFSVDASATPQATVETIVRALKTSLGP